MKVGTPVKFVGVSPFCSHPEGHEPQGGDGSAGGPPIGIFIGLTRHLDYPDHNMEVLLQDGSHVCARPDEIAPMDEWGVTEELRKEAAA